MRSKPSSLLALVATILLAGCNTGNVHVSFESGQDGIFTFSLKDLHNVCDNYPERLPDMDQLYKLISKKTDKGKALILDSEYRQPILIWSMIEDKANFTVVCKQCDRELSPSDISTEKLYRNGASIIYKDKHGHTLLFVVLSKS